MLRNKASIAINIKYPKNERDETIQCCAVNKINVVF